MKHCLLFIIAFHSLLLPKISFAQCNCQQELLYTIKKVETTYPGYLFAVDDSNRKKYEDLKSKLITQSQKTTYDDCYFILNEYLGFFHDDHLSVSESPNPSQQQIDSAKKSAAVYKLTREDAVNYFKAHATTLDPIEGIWQNDTYQIAIIKKDKDHFIGVMLSSKNKNWEPSQIKVELNKESDNNYAVNLYNGLHIKTHSHAEIWKNVLMNLGPYKWVRSYPEDLNSRYVNMADPEQPTLQRMDANNMILTLPSFLINPSYLDSLLQLHDHELRTTTNLVIDLRGNLGGNLVYGNLLRYIYTDPMKQYGSRCIASDDNINYFNAQVESAKKNGYENKFAKNILDILQNNKGKIVEVIPPNTDKFDSVYEYPKRVAIITDYSNRSSAEAFLKYYAKQSKKVIQFGDRTHGVLDYGSVSGIPLSCPSDKYVLFYPVFFENNLPAAGINKTGIAPDVKLNASVKDQIGFVADYLKTHQ